jgi:serine/threonine protein kinase
MYKICIAHRKSREKHLEMAHKTVKKATEKVVGLLTGSQQGSSHNRIRFVPGAGVFAEMQKGPFMRRVVADAVEDLEGELNFVVNGANHTYQLGEELGRGYWGRVFAAKDENGRDVAIKVLEPNEQAREILKTQNITLVELLGKETIPLDQSNCSHIVPRRFDKGKEDNFGFIVMPKYEQFLDLALNEKENRKCLSNGLNLDQIIGLSKDIATGLGEIHTKLGRAYGDLKPDNIALDASGTALINDLGTTTIGRTLGRRGLMGYEFTRAPENWDENAKPTKTGDIWAFGSLMYRMFTGKYIFEEELSQAEDPEKYLKSLDSKTAKEIIDKKLSLIPKQYQEFLRTCLNPDVKERYQDASQLTAELQRVSTIQEADKIVKYDFKQRLKRGLVMAGCIALTMLGLGGAVKLASFPEKHQLEQRIQEAKKYEVIAQINGEGLEVDNNYVELSNVRVSGDAVKDDEGHFLKLREIFSPEKKDSASPGEELTLSFDINYKPLPHKSREGYKRLEGKVYIEGLDSTKFSTTPTPFDRCEMDNWDQFMFVDGNVGGAFIKYSLPKDIPEGVHNLIFEIYAPTNSADSNVKFSEGEILTRKVIPVCVGENKGYPILGKASIRGYQNSFYLRTPGIESIATNLIYEAGIPEEGFTETLSPSVTMKSASGSINLPKGTNTDERILEILARQNGKVVYSTYLPVKREKITNKDYWWSLSKPSTNFSEKVRNIRNNQNHPKLAKYDPKK